MSAAVLRARRNVRHRLAPTGGATGAAPRSVDQPSHATPNAMPAAVPPVPSGTTMVSGGASSCVPSSSVASKCPSTARGSAPPPGIHRGGPLPRRRAARHARSTAQGKVTIAHARTTRSAARSVAAAIARLVSVSGCGNVATAVRCPCAAADRAVARQWLDPVPPTVTNTDFGGAPANRNSSPRILLPPAKSSRLSQSIDNPNARARAGCASSGVGHAPRLHGVKAVRIFVANTAERSMQVTTDYIRHAARAARKCAGDPLGGAPQAPDPEFYKTLAKALEQIAAGMEALGKQE